MTKNYWVKQYMTENEGTRQMRRPRKELMQLFHFQRRYYYYITKSYTRYSNI